MSKRPVPAGVLRVRRGAFSLVILSLLLAIRGTAGTPDAEILAPGVAVRQAPALSAKVVAELQAGAQVEVLFTQNGPGGGWTQITLPSGGTGFVPEQALRRLTAAPQWRLTGAGGSITRTTQRMGQGALDIPLRRAGGVFLVSARINDQVTSNFIVDSGASTVTISHALADQLGLAYANKPTRTFVTASGFETSPMIVLASIGVPDQNGAAVANVEAAVSTLPGAPSGIAGLLGQSFLRHFHVTIEAERGVMHLQPLSGSQ